VCSSSAHALTEWRACRPAGQDAPLARIEGQRATWARIRRPHECASLTVRRPASSGPFALYYNRYLAITLKHYDAATYYDHLIEMHEVLTSNWMLLRRLTTKAHPAVRFIHGLRTLATRAELADFRRIRAMLGRDAHFGAFHDGRSNSLPDFYTQLFEERLGRYAELMPPEARRPIVEPPAPLAEWGATAPPRWPFRDPDGRRPRLRSLRQRRNRLLPRRRRSSGLLGGDDALPASAIFALGPSSTFT
jgi:hypothetical protein